MKCCSKNKIVVMNCCYQPNYPRWLLTPINDLQQKNQKHTKNKLEAINTRKFQERKKG